MQSQSTTKHQFDFSHIRIDEKLQGARLASFSRRAVAYLTDWIIISACSQFIWLVLPLLLVFFIVKKKLKRTMVKGRRMIRKNILLADQKLETFEIDPKLRKRFARSMTFYLYALMYAPIVLAVVLLAGFIINLISPQSYDAAVSHTGTLLGTVFRPVSDMNNALGLITSFLGAFIYFSVFTWKWKGQTPGKRLMRIKVVRLNGESISFWNSLERASGYTASTAIFFYGFFQYFWDRNCQTTHDKIMETIVVES